ncbi:MAG TPA: hypothetical protein VGG30_08635, partial [Pirellulales bacterium]
MLSPNQHVLEFVDAYVYKVLQPDEDESVAMHCRHCPICKVALEEAEKRYAALRAMPAPVVSEELLKRLDNRLAGRRRYRLSPLQTALAGIAAAALLIACGHYYFSSLRVSPYDLRLLGQAELMAGSEASLRVLLLDHDTAKPIGSVPVTIELRSPDGKQAMTLCKAVTDRAGTIAPQMHWPDWQDGDYQLRVTARVGSSSEQVTRGIKLHRAWQLMLSS